MIWAPLAAGIEPTKSSCDLWPLGPTDWLFIVDLSGGLLIHWDLAGLFN